MLITLYTLKNTYHNIIGNIHSVTYITVQHCHFMVEYTFAMCEFDFLQCLTFCDVLNTYCNPNPTLTLRLHIAHMVNDSVKKIAFYLIHLNLTRQYCPSIYANFNLLLLKNKNNAYILYFAIL